jgi:hypothetical protein
MGLVKGSGQTSSQNMWTCNEHWKKGVNFDDSDYQVWDRVALTHILLDTPMPQGNHQCISQTAKQPFTRDAQDWSVEHTKPVVVERRTTT